MAAAIAATVLVLAGCGPGPASTDAGGTSATGSMSPSAIAFSACMRGHGVPSYPDPDIKGMPGRADPRQLGVSPALFQVAERTCRPLLPTDGSLQQQTQRCVLFGECPQALVQQLLAIERQWAQCLRAHGVPNWPDPVISAKGGRPVFDLSGAGMDPRSANTPQALAEEAACRQLVGSSVPNLPTT
ncbi:MAG TPA: hypothetical protein VHW64_14640 [Nocardioides sp.]|uniref:hypothetical protein n=1 Tax=Nocardioides sp. TaxID=35761 RepID=UPI002E30232F|nr:hypothetical protein [Nocardioides sp.]HEX3931939.1 hypothetical protein [Nocardioides sp.]